MSDKKQYYIDAVLHITDYVEADNEEEARKVFLFEHMRWDGELQNDELTIQLEE